MGLSIAFFGSSLVSSRWNGAATYYRGILRALADRGHRAVFYEPDAFERQAHRDIPDPPWAKVEVYSGEAGVSAALAAARGADVLVKASGVGVFDEFLEAAVLEQRHRSGLVVFWDVDAPATLDRVEGDTNDAFRALIPRYDAIFTYGGGPAVVNRYLALGARSCTPIYNGLDPEVHHPEPPDAKFSATLGFLANRMPDREARADSFFFDVAARAPEFGFVLGGSGWESKAMPPNVRSLGHVYSWQHNAFNASQAYVLNVNRDSMAKAGYSPATRLFEAAGAGACIISDAWAGIDQFFEPEHEILLAASGDEVLELLRSDRSRKRQEIGLKARKRALAEHTYAGRALEFERALGLVTRRVA